MKKIRRIGLVVVCVVIVCGMIHVYAATRGQSDTLKEGITIGGVDVGGMTYHKANKAVTQMAKEKIDTKVSINVNKETVNVSLKDLGYKWDNDTVVEEALGAGKKGNIIKRYIDEIDIKNNGKEYDIEVAVEKDDLIEALKEHCEKYNKKAKDATIEFNSSGFDIVPEQNGCEIDYEETAQNLEEYIVDSWDGSETISVDATVENTEPKYTTKDFEKISPTPMGSFTTAFSVGGSFTNRNLNIKNGVEKINGSVLYPGDEFSCNEKLIPWTEENGWYPAGTYSDGEVVDSLGGGICQVSSTLYNALLNAEITITERYSHSMAVAYVELAADAALAGDYKDLKFKNDTDAPLYIQGIYQEGQLTFRVYGHDTRKASHSVKYVSVTKKTIPIKESVKKDPKKPKDYKEIESNGHVGYIAELYKVTYENGVEVSREKLHTSTYAMSPRKVIKGTGKKEDKKKDKSKDEQEKTTKNKDKEKTTEKQTGNKKKETEE